MAFLGSTASGGARIAAASLLALILVAPPGSTAKDAEGPAVPRFVDDTRRSGLEHVYDGEFEFFVGGGVAAFDCDEDRRTELYLAGGSGAAGLYHNDSEVGGALRFTRILDPATDLASVTGAYPLDIDGDGVTDLVVLRHGENVLLRGTGGCRFERANERWSFDGGDGWTTAFSAKWEDSSSFPTLALGEYVDVSSEDMADRCPDNQLVRADRSRQGYAPATALAPGWCPLSMLFSDWDRSGRIDLRISNDRHYYPEPDGEEQLWRVAPGERPRLYTREDGWQPLRLWGMGIASHDLTGDGYPEVYLTSIGPNRLQTLADGPGQPTYEDISRERGVTATNPVDDPSLPSTAWHDEFADVNNDGSIDLFVAKGNVDAMPDAAMEDPSVLFLGRRDGTFVDKALAAGIRSVARARGAALVDLNLDGLLDLVVSNRRESARVWRNVGSGTSKRPRPMGDWVALRLAQSGSNRDAIGAWVEIRHGDRTLTREVTVGGGHAGGQLGWRHFGLGDGKRRDPVRVRVQWPGRGWGPWQAVPANTFGLLEQGSDEIRRWEPKSRPASRG